MEIIIASNNQGKIKEFKQMLEPLGYNVYSQKEKNINIEVEETGKTFEENAKLKAEAIYKLTKTSVLSDDSGIEIETLNNAPGIYSARYKGLKTDKERRQEILKELKDIENRKARFICSICYINESGNINLFKGIWNGKISQKEKGNNGFGYDSIFIPEEKEKETVAELSDEYKKQNSHRAKAIKQLEIYLKNEKNKKY